MQPRSPARPPDVRRAPRRLAESGPRRRPSDPPLSWFHSLDPRGWARLARADEPYEHGGISCRTTSWSTKKCSTYRPRSGSGPGSRAWSSTPRCTGARSTTPTPSGPRWPRRVTLVQDVGHRPEPRLRQGQDPVVRRRQAQRLLQLPRSPSGHGGADKVAFYWEGDSPGSDAGHHLPAAVGRRDQVRQRPQEARASRRATG